MEERVSGFVVTGSWGRVVEHGERVTAALESCDVDTDSEIFQEWDDWRPKPHERLGNDISEKTAEKAAVDKGKGEEKGRSPNEDIHSAGERVNDSLSDLRHGQARESAEDWQSAVLYAARAADSASRKICRAIETWLYKNMMTALSPYYFDNRLVQANISKQGTLESGEKPEYTFEVNIVDDELKEQVGERLREYEDEVDRWHLETKKQTDIAEAVEGADVPENAKDFSSRQMEAEETEEDSQDDCEEWCGRYTC